MANITGNNDGNLLNGTPDRDHIDGRGGNDVLFGGGGNDDLLGGDSPESGIGRAIGGAFGGVVGGLVSLLAGPAIGIPVSAGLGALGEEIGEEFRAGNDDRLFGGDGEDNLLGQAGNDLLSGGDDTDFLDGGGGNDVLSGDDGIDHLNGRDGNDLLSGGNDLDLFVFGTFPALTVPSFVSPGPVATASSPGATGPVATASPGAVTTVTIPARNNDTILDFSRSDGEFISVDVADPRAAEDRVDNRPNDGLIDARDRNVTALNLDTIDGPDSLRLNFGDGNTLTLVGETSLAVNDDIFYV